MNNYHLFLIRSNCMLQLAAHLVAGIVAFFLVSSITAAPKESNLPETPAVVRLAHPPLPTPAPLLANK